MTFTNKAAGEMRERIEALVPRSRVWVGTFHGFCAGMLRKYAPLVGIDPGFSIYDQNDRLRAVKDVMEQIGWDEPGWTPERVESAISRAKNDLVRPQGAGNVGPRSQGRRCWPGLRGLRGAAPRGLGRRFRRPARPHRRDPQGTQGRPRRPRPPVQYVLVDEYQDTNLAQYAIVRRCRSTIPTSASPATPISRSTAGAAPTCRTSSNSSSDYPGCRVVTLERNYRSTKNILSVADHLIRFNRKRKPKALLHREPAAAQPVELTIYPRETDEAEGVAAKIAALVREGEYGFADIAVFCRVTALTRPFEQAFRSARIPYQIVGGVAFYERQEVKDVLAYLNLMVNPKDDLAFARVVNVPPRGLGKTSIEHLAAAARERRNSAPGHGPARPASVRPSRRRPAAGWKTSPD